MEIPMRTQQALLLLVFSTATTGIAQTPVPFSHAPGADHLPRDGKYTVDLHHDFERSLFQLAEKAELIVDGIVTANLPAFNYNPEIAMSIQTDSRIAVNSTITGSVENGELYFLLAQHGGKVGELEIEAVNSPIVKSGEQYIFFLRRGERTIPDHGIKLPRYYSVGIWSGLLRVEAGKVRIAETAESALRHEDSRSIDDFKALILDTINNRIPVPEHERPAEIMFKPRKEPSVGR